MSAILGSDASASGAGTADEDEVAVLVAELELRAHSLEEAITTISVATGPEAPSVTEADVTRVARDLEAASHRLEAARARANDQKRAMKQWWSWWEELPVATRAAEAARVERESHARARAIASIEAEVLRLTEAHAALQREATFLAAARATTAGDERPRPDRLEHELAEARAALEVARAALGQSVQRTT